MGHEEAERVFHVGCSRDVEGRDVGVQGQGVGVDLIQLCVQRIQLGLLDLILFARVVLGLANVSRGRKHVVEVHPSL